jgi:hypothetical protein
MKSWDLTLFVWSSYLPNERDAEISSQLAVPTARVGEYY